MTKAEEIMIDNASCASQNRSLIDDEVTREAIFLNIIQPMNKKLQKVLTDAYQMVGCFGEEDVPFGTERSSFLDGIVFAQDQIMKLKEHEDD